MAITTSTTLSDSQITIFDEAVIISGQEMDIIDAFVDYGRDVPGVGIEFTIYSKLPNATTPLTDGTDVTSILLDDNKVSITPREYGNAVTTTKLANIHTAGKADLAAAKVVGINKVSTKEALGIAELESGINTIVAGTAGTLSKLDLRAARTALKNNGIPTFGGRYIAFVNPDQVSDIADDIINIAKYTSYEMATNGVYGQVEGFTIIEHPGITSGTVVCFGEGYLGKGQSLPADTTIVDGTDKLGRTRHYGWFGIFEYALVNQDAGFVITGA